MSWPWSVSTKEGISAFPVKATTVYPLISMFFKDGIYPLQKGDRNVCEGSKGTSCMIHRKGTKLFSLQSLVMIQIQDKGPGADVSGVSNPG